MTEEETSLRPSRRVRGVLYGVAALWLVIDQLTKWWAESTLSLGVYVPVIGDLLGWRLVYNPGAAFGIAADYTWILAIVAAGAVVGLSWFSTRVSHPLWVVGVSALLGGAVSHLGDRLFRDPGFGVGHIVDFIDYAGFFVGNVADIALVGGAIVLVLASFIAPPMPEPEPEPSPTTVNATEELGDLPWEQKDR